jgi:hypothetical protein
MSSAKIVPDEAKDQFWSVVKTCLRVFHKMSPDTTRRKATQLRHKIDTMPPESLELFYHSEPFDVACDLANHPLNLEKHLDQYLQIRDEKLGNGALKQVLRRAAN